jgi:hypothetical protein
MPDREAFDLW